MNCLLTERDRKRHTNRQILTPPRPRLTRRNFLATLAAAGAVLRSLALFPAAAISSETLSAGNANDQSCSRSGVVSFHMDQPYFDKTGVSTPYYPPSGARSAAPVAHLSETAFRNEYCYL